MMENNNYTTFIPDTTIGISSGDANIKLENVRYSFINLF